MEFTKFKEILDEQIGAAISNTKKFHTLVLDHTIESQADYKINSAILYLSEAYSLINTANILYLTNCEQGECKEFETLVHTFKVLNTEFLNSYSTNHSLQWTDIEYTAFIEAVKVYSTDLM